MERLLLIADQMRALARDDDQEYGLEYARSKTTVISADGPEFKKSRNNRAVKNRNAAVGAKTEYESYAAAASSPSLSGTGIVVRIIPEAQPLPPAVFIPNTQLGSDTAQGPLGASDLSILSMRPQSFRTRYDDIIGNISNSHRIDPLFLHAVIYQESRYRPSAVSHAGATGLMQIMPGTGKSLGVHPSRLTDPVTNVDAGARLLRKLHYKYNGNFELVLAAYNAGEGAVAKYGNSIPPYRETQNYVKQVMARYSTLLAEQNAMVSPQ
jgi:soluble lytic murein transglycosylase-like protein